MLIAVCTDMADNEFLLLWSGLRFHSATPVPGTGPRGQLETFALATVYKSAQDISLELGNNTEDLVTFTPEKLFSLTNSLY